MLLTSIRALVTRPQVQAQSLAEAIRSRQGHAWVLPMLTIAPVTETPQMRSLLLELDQFDKVIVTSQHAAHYGLTLIDQYWPQLPVATDWFAIGPQTANTLSYYGIDVKTPSESMDSEALLNLNDLSSVRQQKILIIKGKGGRTLMADTLKARGAIIEQLETYERKSPDYTTNPLPDVLRKKRINTVLCASGETVTNLLNFLPESEMPQLSLVVPSQRIASAFAALPFRQVTVSEGAGNKAVLAALEGVEHQLTRSGQINKHSEELS